MKTSFNKWRATCVVTCDYNGHMNPVGCVHQSDTAVWSQDFINTTYSSEIFMYIRLLWRINGHSPETKKKNILVYNCIPA